MPLGYRRVSKPETVHRARAEVFDENVGARDKRVEDRAAARMLEVERDAFFVAVDAEEIGALALDEGGTPAACIVPLARLFDLDDAGAHVGQHHRAVRAG